MATEYKGHPIVSQDVLRWNIDRVLQIPEVAFFLHYRNSAYVLDIVLLSSFLLYCTVTC